MEYKIKHLPERRRFVTEIDGVTAFVEYTTRGEYLDILHTIVPGPIEGRGIASALVGSTYKYALENGYKCNATCSYAVRWLERHPEYSA